MTSVLVVEDDRAARDMFRTALLSAGFDVVAVSDGVDALRAMEADLPGAVVLDLNLPRKGGREVLAEIKRDPKLKCIPVVILTTSEAEQDIADSYQQHANCYIVKPVDLDQFIGVVRTIEGFWLQIVKLPPYEEE